MKRFGGETKKNQVHRDSSTKVANWLMLLSRGQDGRVAHPPVGRIFTCKICNRQFQSLQALGGHRSSHKKIKPINDHPYRSIRKPKTHECSICGVAFKLGQALGGHMRRHTNLINGYPDALPAAVEKSNPIAFPFDLNLTPLENDLETTFGGSGFDGEINMAH